MLKKVLITVISIIVAIGLFACGNNAEVEELKKQVAELKQQQQTGQKAEETTEKTIETVEKDTNNSNQPKVNSWYKSESGDWYYYNDDTTMPIQNTFFVDDADNTYYLGGDGKIVTGWQVLDGKLYYFNEDNYYAPNWHETNSNAGDNVKPYGALYKNETTPLGLYANEEGFVKLNDTDLDKLNFSAEKFYEFGKAFELWSANIPYAKMFYQKAADLGSQEAKDRLKEMN